MSEHTPLSTGNGTIPAGMGYEKVEIFDPSERVVIEAIGGSQDEARLWAQTVVRAVNGHDGLLAALEASQATIEALLHSEQNPTNDKIAQKASDCLVYSRRLARAALAKVRT